MGCKKRFVRVQLCTFRYVPKCVLLDGCLVVYPWIRVQVCTLLYVCRCVPFHTCAGVYPWIHVNV